MRRTLFVLVLLIGASFGLSGCDSAEEKAQKHYLSGMALAEAGDVPRALIELRNAFTFDPRHPQARLAYARLAREAGDLGEAYGQYQLVIETAPDTVEARRALAEIAFLVGDWTEAERHGQALQRLDPDSTATGLITAALAYHAAVLAKDAPTAAAAARTARETLKTDPASLIARHIVIDQTASAGGAAAALVEIEAALAVLPAERDFHQMRLRLLAELRDSVALGPALESYVAQFPQDEQGRQMMIAWYIDKGDLTAAEAYLRRLADAVPVADPDATPIAPALAGPDPMLAARMTLIEFLLQARGEQAGRAELDRRIAAETAAETAAGLAAGLAALPYRTRLAALDFDLGKTAAAIAALTALVDGPGPGLQGEDLVAEGHPEALHMLHEAKVTLARMLMASGDLTAAQARIDEVLAKDPAHVAALKLRAGWLIDADRPAEAITALRSAQGAAPRDAEILMLMGGAHDRDGAHELAAESYARAVEASGRAPVESLFYAGFLAQDGRLDSAAAVLGDALRLAPRNRDLLIALARIRLEQKDPDAALDLVTTLRSLGAESGDEQAETAARAIETEVLLLQDRVDDTIASLRDMAVTGEGNVTAAARMVQVQIEAGKIAEARAFLDSQLGTHPDEPTLLFLRAGIHVLDRAPDKAEAIYRGLLAQTPGAEPPLRALYGLLQQEARSKEATALLQTTMAALPDAPLPRILLAAERETAGDVAGAVGLYEALYARDSGNLVVANNLASLMVADLTVAERSPADQAALERATTIAKRLRGSQVAAFQDTYGWLETLRGNPTGALPPLEAAARGLPNDALVQYHLGMTYLALERIKDARRLLILALTLAGDSPLPALVQARAEIARQIARMPPP
jgi:cellulose synthase operon protein C